MPTILEEFSNAMASLNRDALRSLVQVRRAKRSIGSGGIWHENGLIVTNAHVVADRRGPADNLSVSLPDGQTLAARVVAFDGRADLAALQVEAKHLPAFSLGDSRHLQPGEFVWALGFPWGIHGGATIGTVIGVGTQVGDLRGDGRQWLAASLHLRPGHSGGPMVDAQGRLVGINTLMNGPDVGVAIPVHVVQEFLHGTPV